MLRSSRFLSACVVLLGAVTALSACGASEDDSAEGFAGDDSHEAESALTRQEKDAICNSIQPGREWTREEADRLSSLVIGKFIEVKRQNDALIRERGVGTFAGFRSPVKKLIDAGQKQRAAAAIRPHLKPGHNAAAIVEEIKSTSCIGWVLKLFRDAYAELGRTQEWQAVEKCTRAWDSDGLHFQQALMKSGWPSPALPIVADQNQAAGNANEKAMHREFLRAVVRGTYYGTPLSTDTMLRNFLLLRSSPTTRDTSMLTQIGQSNFIAVGTLRAAYHVPLLVPASAVPEDMAPDGADHDRWLTARQEGEPFVFESHSLREPWDPTNFEIRPLLKVMGETFSQSVVYSTGTMLFGPLSDSPLAQ